MKGIQSCSYFWNRVVLDPSVANESVEVLARIHFSIDRVQDFGGSFDARFARANFLAVEVQVSKAAAFTSGAFGGVRIRRFRVFQVHEDADGGEQDEDDEQK